MIAAAARQLVPPSSVCPHQPQHVGSSTKTLLASSEAHMPQRNCLRRPGDPNSVGTGTATGSAALAMKDGGPKQRPFSRVFVAISYIRAAGRPS